MEIPIPPALLGLTPEKATFMEALLSESSKGVIIYEVAFLDFLIAEVLTEYFCSMSRQSAFADLIIPRLSFDEKIGVLHGMPLQGTAVEMRDRIVARLRPMQRLRNVAAHAAGLMPDEVDKLYSDQAKRDLLANFPTEFRKAAKEVEQDFHQLKKDAAFRGR
jgi:hypothetical protein